MCTHYFSDDMLWWYFKQEWKNNWDHSHFKWLQVPFSFSRYRSLAYILMNRYLLFKFALPFSLARTYKRLVQPYRGFLRLCRYSKTFLRTFITHVHIQSLLRSRDAATIAENWSLTERRFRHLERTVLGRYLLSCHTVFIALCCTGNTDDISGSGICSDVRCLSTLSIFALYPCRSFDGFIMQWGHGRSLAKWQTTK